MKAGDVPQQDQGSILGGHRRACYAQDERGQYVVIPSRGWEVESIVNGAANAEMMQTLAHTHARVLAGELSPLAYHMARRQMNVGLLAAYTGMWQLRIRWHLRPRVFIRLGESILARYAEALALSLSELRELPARPGR